MLDITGDWSNVALNPGVLYSTVCEGNCCRFMTAWAREDEKEKEKASEQPEEEEISGRGGHG